MQKQPNSSKWIWVCALVVVALLAGVAIALNLSKPAAPSNPDTKSQSNQEPAKSDAQSEDDTFTPNPEKGPDPELNSPKL